MLNLNNKAVLLDRDGVIGEAPGRVTDPSEFKFIPRVKRALKWLQEEEYLLILITNQTGIGMGYYTIEDMERINKHICSELENYGVKLNGIYFCPHHPKGVGEYKQVCECRKPKPGMVRQAMREHNIMPSECYFVGDRTVDVAAGKEAGIRTILVRTGRGGEDKQCDVKPDLVVEDLFDAAKSIINNKV